MSGVFAAGLCGVLQRLVRWTVHSHSCCQLRIRVPRFFWVWWNWINISFGHIEKKLKNMDESDETNSFFHADGYRFW